MNHETEFYCPECDGNLERHYRVHRRGFLQAAGAGAAVLAGGLSQGALAAEPAAKVAAKVTAKGPAKPAEGLIRELYSTLSDEQKTNLVYPWDHMTGGRPSRLATFNSAGFGKRMVDHLSEGQRELVERILRATLSSDESFKRISRNGKWDASQSFENCGSLIFGEPTDEGKFAWVFSGHHLTLRCDGNSEPGAAFGGPMFYGHLAGGYTSSNVFRYQTLKVQEVFDALNEEQRKTAMAPGNPGDREAGIKFTPNRPHPGIAYAALSEDQRGLVENVMRVLIEPFRKEDSDEVMEIIKTNGGLEKIHLAFYEDGQSRDGETRWHYWRLEGPGFIWNYRALPHVHCYVNITSQV